MCRNIFICSDAQHDIKLVISEQHQIFFIIRKQHEFLIFVSLIAQNWLTLGFKTLITEQHKMLDFLKG
jgi:hypothetical protein